MAQGLISQATEAPEEVAATAPATEVAAAPVANEEVEGQDVEDNLTPEERESYNTAMEAVGEMLYTDDQSHEAIMQQLQSEEPLRAIAMVTSFIIAQLEQATQGQMPEQLIVPIADEVSDLVMELGEETGVFELSEEDILQAKGAVITSLFEDYGIEEEDLEELLQGVTADEVSGLQNVFGGQ